MATNISMQNVTTVALTASTPKIIAMRGKFSIQPGPGMSITVEGSNNQVAVQAEYNGGSRVAGTWADIAGGAVSGGAIKQIDVFVGAVSLTSSGSGNAYLIIQG